MQSGDATGVGEAPEFTACDDYSNFSHYVKATARHILDSNSHKFVETVIATANKRTVLVPAGTHLWRAQVGHDWRTEQVTGDDGNVVDSFEVPDAHPPARMVPRANQATEGRVNPKGIPCLYLSTDRDTAMSETRPWVGSYVSVAVFVVARELKLVDCTVDPPKGVWVPWRLDGTFEPPPEPAVREQYAWGNINRAFSEPATRSDDVAEYAPTQYLAEAFRHAGYDGIVYGSKLGKGKTVAVFEITAAELVTCQLYSVENIEFKFETSGNPYYVQKHLRNTEDEELTGSESDTSC